jgi:hypothetical protein
MSLKKNYDRINSNPSISAIPQEKGSLLLTLNQQPIYLLQSMISLNNENTSMMNRFDSFDNESNLFHTPKHIMNIKESNLKSTQQTASPINFNLNVDIEHMHHQFSDNTSKIDSNAIPKYDSNIFSVRKLLFDQQNGKT